MKIDMTHWADTNAALRMGGAGEAVYWEIRSAQRDCLSPLESATRISQDRADAIKAGQVLR
jgi:hypothetical protein